MKKLIALFLVLTFSLTLFGCTKKETQKKETHDQNVGSIEQQESDTNEKELIKVKWLISEVPEAAIKDDFAVIKEIEKATNVQIEFSSVPQSGFEEKKKILIASNELPDIASITAKDGRTFGPDGVLVDLAPYIDEYAPNIAKLFKEYPEMKVLSTADDGGIYALPSIQRTGWLSCSFMIREDIMEKHNLQHPETMDEFYELLVELKTLYPDSYPYTQRTTNNTLSRKNGLFKVFTRVFTGIDGEKNENAFVGYNPMTEQYEFAPDSENFKAMLIFLNKIYEEGLLDPEFALIDANQWKQRILQGQSFITYDYKGRVEMLTNEAIDAGINPSFSLEAMPMFAYEDVEPYQSFSPVIDENKPGIGISSNAEEVERLVEYIDYLYSEEGVNLTTFGIKGVTYDVKEGQYVMREEYVADPNLIRKEVGALYDGIWLDARKFKPTRSEKFESVEDVILPFGKEPVKPGVDSEEDRELKTEVHSNVDMYMETEVVKFVIGTTEITDENIASFIEHCEDLGARELLEVYNNNYQEAYGK